MTDSLRDFGKIVISGFEIDPFCTPDKIQKAFKAEIVRQETVNSWLSFYLEDVSILSKPFNTRLMFSPKGKLSFIFLSWHMKNEKAEWENWNETVEMRRVEEHDRFLLELTGAPPYHFDWGEIVSEINPKDSLGSITIRYT